MATQITQRETCHLLCRASHARQQTEKMIFEQDRMGPARLRVKTDARI